MISLKFVAVFGFVLLAHLQACLAVPATAGVSPNENGLLKRAKPKDFYLRIMALGDSITRGSNGAPDDKKKNGYRKHLRDKLRADGWKVNMVGNHNDGSMIDNDHQGVDGHHVSDIKESSRGACYTWLPNLVLINAGTQDAVSKKDPIDETGKRMREVIDGIFAEVPGAVVVLSTLLPNKANQKAVDNINKQYRSLQKQYNTGEEKKDPTFKVVLADMADGFIDSKDLHDGTNPTIQGQRKMAAVWLRAINEANERGFLSKPSKSSDFKDDVEGGTTCRKEWGADEIKSKGGPKVLSAENPEVADDGTYVHHGVERSDVSSYGRGQDDVIDVFFGQLVNSDNRHKGEERDDFIWVDEARTRYCPNNGDGTFGDPVEIETNRADCLVSGMRFGDINGDGVDDFICIAKDGELFVAMNTGSDPPKFKDLLSYKLPEMGLDKSSVRLGDIDGDGRLDYCVVDDPGDVYCWRNPGGDFNIDDWTDMGDGKPVAGPQAGVKNAQVHLVDINGDGRYDWISLDDYGEVTTWINQRGNGKSLIPRWLKAGVTHKGFNSKMGEDDGVKWGRLLHNGKTDYIYHWLENCKKGSSTKCDRKWKASENKGHGGLYQKGDGIYWGDTTGKGVDDFVWISDRGVVNVFVNENTENKTNSYDTPAWGKPSHDLHTEFDRRYLHVGDWNGDGMADIIAVDNRDTGSLRVWYSNYDGKDFKWELDEIDGEWCKMGWGPLYYDHAAHFADITGSGMVDYICMAPNGTATVWIRDKNGKADGSKLKTDGDISMERSQFHFADADGDGMADMIAVDLFTGDGTVFYSKGLQDDGTVAFELPTDVFQGTSRSGNIHFPILGGQHRADMVQIDPTTGEAWVFLNECQAGGDNGKVKDPKLPEYNPKDDKDPDDDKDKSGSRVRRDDTKGNWFCDDENAANWTQGLWKEHGVGRWLIQRSKLYMGRDAEWPHDKDSGDVGVPRTIARYNGLKKDNAFDWPGAGCRDAEGVCEMPPTYLLNKHCTGNPERAFALWAMRNLAQKIQKWLSVFKDAVDTSQMYSSKIADEFLMDAEDNMSPASDFLTAFTGILVALGTAVGSRGKGAGKGGGAMAAGGAAGGLIFASGVTELAENQGPPKDPRYTSFIDLQHALGDFKTQLVDSVIDYYDRLFNFVPKVGDSDGGLELAHILEEGVYANQDSAEADESATSTDISRIIQAAVISEMWNANGMAIIKWSHTGQMADWNWTPCSSGHWDPGDHLNFHVSDKSNPSTKNTIACFDDTNYLIAPVLANGYKPETKTRINKVLHVGQDEATLKKYGLTPKVLIEAAERTQARTNTFMSKNLDGLGDLFKEAFNNMGENPADDLMFINTPVCDLDTLKIEAWETACGEYKRAKQCLMETISYWCSWMALKDDSDEWWPYFYDFY